MAYTPKTWANGQVITADDLNHLEQGVANEQVGPQGPPGPAGADGAAGPQGPAGPDGEAGPAGTNGRDGVGVPAGGAAGQVLSKKTAADYDTQWIDPPETGGGTSGENGATFTPAVSEAGVISWTNDKNLPNPAPISIKGPPGPQGTPGEDGAPGADGQDGATGPAGPPGKDSNPISVAEAVLTSAGWDSETKKQTISVSGVQSDELSQLIQPVPQKSSMEAYFAAGILCIDQAENSLTFQCEEIPTADISLYILLQTLSGSNSGGGEENEIPSGYTLLSFINVPAFRDIFEFSELNYVFSAAVSSEVVLDIQMQGVATSNATGYPKVGLLLEDSYNDADNSNLSTYVNAGLALSASEQYQLGLLLEYKKDNTDGGGFHDVTPELVSQFSNPEARMLFKLKSSSSTYSVAVNSGEYYTMQNPVDMSEATFSTMRITTKLSDLYTSLKIYGFKLYSSNNLQHDMVFVLRTADSVLGCYDKITKAFYQTPAISGVSWEVAQ